MKEAGQSSHDTASAAYLRSIIDAPKGEYTTSERISAIKELRILTASQDAPGGGFGSWTRAEIEAELRRLCALTGG